MQKKLIALAIAGLSSAAFAQSNVTIYGVMDMDFEQVKAKGATQNVAASLTAINQPGLNRVSTNSSHIGFKGSEALGNGMSAVFQVESGINPDVTGGNFATRDSFVGLAGGFGTVLMGHVTGPYRAAVASMEVVPGATGASAGVMNLAGRAVTTSGSITTAAAGSNGGHTVTATRVQNTLAYVTPNFAGLTGTIAHSTGPLGGAESKTTEPQAVGVPSVNAKAWTAGLTYANGPLKGVLAWQSVKDIGPILGGANDVAVDANGETAAGAAVGARSANAKVDSWLVGVGYTFGTTTVNLAYDQNKAKNSDTLAAGGVVNTPVAVLANQARYNDSKAKTWILAAKHVMGNHEVAASFARARVDMGVTYGVGTTNAIKGLNDQGASQFALRYGYNFSKRTQAYAFYSAINNQANGVYNFTTNAAVSATNATGATGANGADPRAIGAGLRHNF